MVFFGVACSQKLCPYTLFALGIVEVQLTYFTDTCLTAASH